MTSPFYEALFDTRISGERDAASEFETNEGGFRLSTSVGGVLTGRGADIIIIDDPLKADDALSETRRRSVNEWYDNTLRSRLNSQENGAIIIVMQRLHADDLNRRSPATFSPDSGHARRPTSFDDGLQFFRAIPAESTALVGLHSQTRMAEILQS